MAGSWAISAVILSLAGYPVANYPDARYYHTYRACMHDRPAAIALAHRYYPNTIVMVTCERVHEH